MTLIEVREEKRRVYSIEGNRQICEEHMKILIEKWWVLKESEV
jgi:hypothetical protein